MDSNGPYLSCLLKDCEFGGSDCDSKDNDKNSVPSEDGDLFGLIPLNDVICNDIHNNTMASMNDLSDCDDHQDHTKNTIETSTFSNAQTHNNMIDNDDNIIDDHPIQWAKKIDHHYRTSKRALFCSFDIETWGEYCGIIQIFTPNYSRCLQEKRRRILCGWVFNIQGICQASRRIYLGFKLHTSPWIEKTIHPNSKCKLNQSSLEWFLSLSSKKNKTGRVLHPNSLQWSHLWSKMVVVCHPITLFIPLHSFPSEFLPWSTHCHSKIQVMPYPQI